MEFITIKEVEKIVKPAIEIQMKACYENHCRFIRILKLRKENSFLRIPSFEDYCRAVVILICMIINPVMLKVKSNDITCNSLSKKTEVRI